jgi:hypothetical protein
VVLAHTNEAVNLRTRTRLVSPSRVNTFEQFVASVSSASGQRRSYSPSPAGNGDESGSGGESLLLVRQIFCNVGVVVAMLDKVFLTAT